MFVQIFTSHIIKWSLKCLIWWIIHHLVIMFIWAIRKGILYRFSHAGRQMSAHTHTLHTHCQKLQRAKKQHYKMKSNRAWKSLKNRLCCSISPESPSLCRSSACPCHGAVVGHFPVETTLGHPCLQHVAQGAPHLGFPCYEINLVCKAPSFFFFKQKIFIRRQQAKTSIKTHPHRKIIMELNSQQLDY